MAAGVLVVSLADAAGRAGSASAMWVAACWLGEVFVFAPLAARVLSRSGPGESEAAGLVMSLAVATYLIKYLYSPSFFRFPDELEHWRTTSNLLSSHHLFGVNHLLPISPYYPGLESATGAVASVTGLPVFAAGLVVAGVAHLLLMAALFVMFRVVSGSPRIAAAACAIYAANPHFGVIDAIYGYQTLALAFMGLAVVAALRISGQPGASGRAGWWVTAVVLIAATVITHHVTSYVLAATLLLLAAVSGARQLLSRRHGNAAPSSGTGSLAALAGVCITLTVAWVGLAAPLTVAYLAPAIRDFVVGGLAGVFTAQPSSSGAGVVGPLAEQLGSYAVAALIVLGVPLGWRQIWRSPRRSTWPVALGAGAAGYYLSGLLRITAPNGTELNGRILTFVYIPVSYTLAMTLARLGQAGLRLRARAGRAAGSDAGAPPRSGRTIPVMLAAAAGGVILCGGIASGWPPYWERLPGRFVADGFESGVSSEGIAAATWARSTLGPGRRIAADFTSYILLGSYGDQDPVNTAGQLYCSPGWTAADAALARRDALRYLLVDLRTSGPAAVNGGFFAGSAGICPAPIPRRDLTKFSAVPGLSRIYDSGNIIVYALPGAGHGR